jgi:hypothetical protein
MLPFTSNINESATHPRCIVPRRHSREAARNCLHAEGDSLQESKVSLQTTSIEAAAHARSRHEKVVH